MISLSRKQIEYLDQANHRWNIKSGAVRSGKSFVDTAAVIPRRIIERIGKPGITVILGVSRDTIERNVLEPMREIYTDKRVGTINSRNVVNLFGEEVYCLGAEKVSHVAKIQGASIKYAYGDEIAKWNNGVFQMLKSRLDKPYSCFDGSCNPEHPTHWLKQFIDSDIDLYLQEYTIFDNPHLDQTFVENLCTEYAGTIYYDRLILGKWKRADGAIYRKFADNPKAFKCAVVQNASQGKNSVISGGLHVFNRNSIISIEIGLDFGGNRSGHAFVARGYTEGMRDVIILMSRRVMASDTGEPIDSNQLDRLFCQFVKEVEYKYGTVSYDGIHNVEGVYWDNAETVLGNSIRNAVEKEFPYIIVRPAQKQRINDRINTTLRLMGSGRFWYTKDAVTIEQALTEAVWDKTKPTDERLDDGSTDIDSLDAMEYTFERDIKDLINV